MIALNLHAPSEDKSDYKNDICCKELKHVLGQFPKWNMIFFSDFSPKVIREDIFKQKIGNKVYMKLLMIKGLK